METNSAEFRRIRAIFAAFFLLLFLFPPASFAPILPSPRGSDCPNMLPTPRESHRSHMLPSPRGRGFPHMLPSPRGRGFPHILPSPRGRGWGRGEVRVILLYRHRPTRVELSAVSSSFACTAPGRGALLLRQGERWVVELAEGRWRILRPGTASFGPTGASDCVRFAGQGPGGRILVKCLKGESGEPAVAASRGDLLVSSGARGLLLVDEIDIESYLAGTLPEEISARFPEEALKVQCIVSRTFALTERGRHRTEGADFCDNSHCQVYGPGDRYPTLDAALRATRGQVVTYRGALAKVFYHSSCGGRTLSAEALWRTDQDLPYLKGVSDQERGKPFCREAPHSQWTRVIPSRELSSLVGWNEEIHDIQVVKGDRRDKRSFVVLSGNRGFRRVPLYEFWTRIVDTLGWGSLGSPRFQVAKQGHGFCFSGRGLGHGVGLCQWGAKGMAGAGYSAEEILGHYFPGTRVGRMP